MIFSIVGQRTNNFHLKITPTCGMSFYKKKIPYVPSHVRYFGPIIMGNCESSTCKIDFAMIDLSSAATLICVHFSNLPLKIALHASFLQFSRTMYYYGRLSFNCFFLKLAKSIIQKQHFFATMMNDMSIFVTVVQVICL